MSIISPANADLRAQAADWVALLHSELPTSDAEAREYADSCRQFVAWVRRSPSHVAAFLRADDVFCRLAGMGSQHRIDIEELRERYAAQHRARERTRFAGMAGHSAKVWVARAACVLVPMVVGLAVYTWRESDTYTTAVGEQREVQLPDGSIMILNTRSRARVDFSAKQRFVHLEAGEALFDVEHNERRPFIVFTSTVRVRALGTRFDIYERGQSQSTTVSVLAGAVQIVVEQGGPRTPPSAPQPTRLSAGEQARASYAGVTREVQPDVADAVAWRDRTLVFRRTPLADVVTEYNRYNTTQIHIEDPWIQRQEMSGTYSADRPETLVRYLEKAFDVSVIRQGDGWVVRGR